MSGDRYWKYMVNGMSNDPAALGTEEVFITVRHSWQS